MSQHVHGRCPCGPCPSTVTVLPRARETRKDTQAAASAFEAPAIDERECALCLCCVRASDSDSPTKGALHAEGAAAVPPPSAGHGYYGVPQATTGDVSAR